MLVTFKGELNPKIKFVLFERTLKITEQVNFHFFIPLLRFWDISVSLICKLHIWRSLLSMTYRRMSYTFAIIKRNHFEVIMCLCFSCGRTVLQYCCCLIAILTAWKKFVKISHRKGSTRVKNSSDVMCLPTHDVTVIIFATFKMCYEHFHSDKRYIMSI